MSAGIIITECDKYECNLQQRWWSWESTYPQCHLQYGTVMYLQWVSGTKPEKYTEKISTITIQISVLHRGHARLSAQRENWSFQTGWQTHGHTHTHWHTCSWSITWRLRFSTRSHAQTGKTFKFTSSIYIIVSLWVTFISAKCCRLPPFVAADSCVTQSACSVTLTPSPPEPQGWKWQISTCRFPGITCARVPVPLRGKVAAR